MVLSRAFEVYTVHAVLLFWIFVLILIVTSNSNGFEHIDISTYLTLIVSSYNKVQMYHTMHHSAFSKYHTSIPKHVVRKMLLTKKPPIKTIQSPLNFTNLLLDFNLLTTTVFITEEPVKWFILQINWLVSIRWEF